MIEATTSVGVTNVPPLSTERRKQLVGRLKELAEEARVAIRNIRRDGNKHADQAEKNRNAALSYGIV